MIESLQISEKETEVQAPKISHFQPCLDAFKDYREAKNGERGQFLPFDQRQWELRSILGKMGIKLPKNVRVSVYNPSLPIQIRNEELMLCRVEGSRKADEHASFSILFLRKGECWTPLFDFVLSGQDPNVTYVKGRLIMSDVELKKFDDEEYPRYRMVFYKANEQNDVYSLTRSFEGPWNQKCTRLCNVGSKIGIYTRPQGVIGGAGQIGFTTADSLEELEEHGAEIIEKAPLLNTRFPDGEWGGINQVLPCPDGRNVLIGHRARFDNEGKKHYYPWACIHDPYTGEVEDLGILTERADFEPSTAKAPDLEDVLYTVGLIEKNGEWFLLVGISDAHIGIIKIQQKRLFPQSRHGKLAA